MGFFSKKHGGLKDYTDHVFCILQDNFTHAVDNFIDTKFPKAKSKISSLLSKINFKETDNEYIFTAEIPGVEKMDAKFENGILTVVLKKKIKGKKIKSKIKSNIKKEKIHKIKKQKK